MLVAFEHRAHLGLDHVGCVEVGETCGLLHDLDHREVRDPVAVRQAPAAEQRLPDRPRRSRNSATRRDLPDAGGPEDGEQADTSDRPRPRRTPAAGARADARAPPSASRAAAGAAGRAFGHRDQPEGRDEFGLALQLERLRRARPPRRRGRAACVPTPIRTSPGAAACSRRAATFTASPVTSAWPAAGSPATTSPVFTPIRRRERDALVAFELLVEPAQRLAHLGGRADRAQGIVLVHTRDPEHRHDGVADELLDGAAVALDRSPSSPRSSGPSPGGAPRGRASRRAPSSRSRRRTRP